MAIVANRSGNIPTGAPTTDPATTHNKSVLGPNQVASIIVAIGAASVQSAAFDSKINSLRISPGVDCFYKVGSNPTATANDIPLYSKQVEFIDIKPGDKIAVIQNGAVTGNLTCTPVQ